MAGTVLLKQNLADVLTYGNPLSFPYTENPREVFTTSVGKSSVRNPASKKMPPRSKRNFVRLENNSKKPKGKNGRLDRDSLVPAEGNYGFIPSYRQLILDIDATEESSLVAHVLVLQELFGFTANETLAVQTPSGGLHLYLNYPRGFGKIKEFFNGSLRQSSQALLSLVQDSHGLTELDVDVRNGRTENYVVGPDSSGLIAIPHQSQLASRKKYRIFAQYASFADALLDSPRDVPAIATADKKKMNALLDLYCELHPHTDLATEKKKSEQANTSTNKKVQVSYKNRYTGTEDRSKRRDWFNGVSTHNRRQKPVKTLSGNKQEKLSVAMDKVIRSGKDYHAKRCSALVRLGLCASVEDVVPIVRQYDMDRDTYHQKILSDKELLADLKRASEKVLDNRGGQECHGILCNHSHNATYVDAKQEKFVPSPYVVKRFRPRSYKNYRAVHFDRVENELLKSFHGRQVKDALRILAVFNGAMCSGAWCVLAGRDYLAEMTGLTKNQVAQGLRILREAGIIYLYARQQQGRTSSYVVRTEFVDYLVSRELQDLRYNSRTPYFVKTRMTQEYLTNILPVSGGGFVGVHSGEYVENETSGVFSPKNYSNELFQISLETARRYTTTEKNFLSKVGRSLDKRASYSLKEARNFSNRAHQGNPKLPSATRIRHSQVSTTDWQKVGERIYRQELAMMEVNPSWFEENSAYHVFPQPKNHAKEPLYHHLWQRFGNGRPPAPPLKEDLD